MLAVLRQPIFGWDTSIGVWAFVLCSLAFEEPARFWFLMIALLGAYLPDFDFLPYMLLRRRLGDVQSHWVFGHYPLILLPAEAYIVFAAAAVLSPGHEWFLVTMTVVATTGHFCHDASAKLHGFPLLAPITRDGGIRFPVPWTKHHPMHLYVFYRIGWGSFIEEVPREEVHRMYEVALQLKESRSELVGRAEPVTFRQLAVSLTGFAALTFLFL